MRHFTLLLLALLMATPSFSANWKLFKKRKAKQQIEQMNPEESELLDTTWVRVPIVEPTIIPALEADYEPSLKDTIQDWDMQTIESIEENIDTLLNDWYTENYVQFDPNCVAADEAVTFSDSVYVTRLASLPNVIEMPFNQIVKSYINTYTQRGRKLTSYLLGVKDFYFPLFEQELEKEGMPLELKYLPVIESALKPNATSYVGAAGLWQFMLSTGKMYGLEVNSYVDERRDPIQSTQAAVHFLKDLYGIYNDWTLAIAAYNCGPGNVNKAIRRAGGVKDYWQIYYYLPRETRGYVPAFIAVNYAMNFYEEHQICPAIAEALPIASDTVMVQEMVHLQQIAESLDMPVELVRSLNPQYRLDIVPGNSKPCAIRLPNQELYAFIDQQDSIVAKSVVMRRKTAAPAGYTAYGNTPSGPYSLHKIRSGESLSTIAARYGVSVTTLKRWNNLYSTRIRAGKTLRIYGKSATASSSASSKTVWKGDVGYHTVARGESLWTISRQFTGVTVESIKQLNNLRSNSLKVGQVLKIPKV